MEFNFLGFFIFLLERGRRCFSSFIGIILRVLCISKNFVIVISNGDRKIYRRFGRNK